MNTLNYYTHILIHTPYRFIIVFFINFLIYLSFHYNSLSYCMNEINMVGGSSIPIVAEIKETSRPSHQLLALKNEVVTFAGIQAHLMDRVDEQARHIIEQTSIINNLTMERDRAQQNFRYLNTRMQDIMKHDLDSNRLNHQRIDELTSIKTRQYHKILEQKQQIKNLQDTNSMLVGVLLGVGFVFGVYILYKNTGDVSDVQLWKKQYFDKISKL